MDETVVLLAEDEATIRSLVTISLEQQHIRVVPACDADEALQLARKHERIDLLLTDVQMAGSINGVELAECLQAERPGLPVLVMSGFPDSLALAAEKGYPALAKPFTPATLTERVREVLAARIPAQSEQRKPNLRKMTG